MPCVYLAGPITRCTREEAEAWRRLASQSLALRGIDTISPLRPRPYLAGPLTDQDIVARDTSDIRRADALLVNLLDATQVSIGTVMEIALAWEQRKPVVLVMEPDGNCHDHPFLRVMVTVQVPTLAAGIAAVGDLLYGSVYAHPTHHNPAPGVPRRIETRT